MPGLDEVAVCVRVHAPGPGGDLVDERCLKGIRKRFKELSVSER